jgi:hypothetical protein
MGAQQIQPNLVLVPAVQNKAVVPAAADSTTSAEQKIWNASDLKGAYLSEHGDSGRVETTLNSLEQSKLLSPDEKFRVRSLVLLIAGENKYSDSKLKELLRAAISLSNGPSETKLKAILSDLNTAGVVLPPIFADKKYLEQVLKNMDGYIKAVHKDNKSPSIYDWIATICLNTKHDRNTITPSKMAGYIKTFVDKQLAFKDLDWLSGRDMINSLCKSEKMQGLLNGWQKSNSPVYMRLRQEIKRRDGLSDTDERLNREILHLLMQMLLSAEIIDKKESFRLYDSDGLMDDVSRLFSINKQGDIIKGLEEFMKIADVKFPDEKLNVELLSKSKELFSPMFADRIETTTKESWDRYQVLGPNKTWEQNASNFNKITIDTDKYKGLIMKDLEANFPYSLISEKVKTYPGATFSGKTSQELALSVLGLKQADVDKMTVSSQRAIAKSIVAVLEAIAEGKAPGLPNEAQLKANKEGDLVELTDNNAAANILKNYASRTLAASVGKPPAADPTQQI